MELPVEGVQDGCVAGMVEELYVDSERLDQKVEALFCKTGTVVELPGSKMPRRGPKKAAIAITNANTAAIAPKNG